MKHLVLLVQRTNPHSAICGGDVSTSVGNYSHLDILPQSAMIDGGREADEERDEQNEEERR